MEALVYLLNFVFDTYIMILVLRVWLQCVRADFYNPLSQFVVKVTNPVVIPLRRIIPGFKGIDVATLLVAYIVSCLKLIAFWQLNVYQMEPISSLYLGFFLLLKQCGYLLFTIMLAMALMSWVVRTVNPITMVFHQLTQPFLKPIRSIIPDLGGLDLSVAIAFFFLMFLNKLIAGFLPFWYIL